MPHQLSLVRRIADLRRLYTGETDTTVNHDAAHAASVLSTDDRRQLRTALERDFFDQLPGGDDVRPLPQHLRTAVLPDATEPWQQALEARIFRAVTRTTAHLDHPAAAVGAWLAGNGGRVLRKVRPQRPHDLTLHVNGRALAPLLFELLPRITGEGDLVGVPGLRAVLHRRRVELLVLDTPARVTIANVSYRQWVAALAFVDAVDSENPLRWLGNDPQPLQHEEREALARVVSGTTASRLLSCLLRRIGLFSTTSRLSLRRASSDEVEIDWWESPSAAAIAVRLVDPAAGLFGSDHFVAGQGDRLKITDADEAYTVVLGQLRPEDTDDVAARWSAWDREMSRPNPMWPSIVGARRPSSGLRSLTGSASH